MQGTPAPPKHRALCDWLPRAQAHETGGAADSGRENTSHHQPKQKCF